MKEPAEIRPRDRDAVLQSLRAGLVPFRGLQHIQVGRAKEVEALLGDIQRIAGGGAACRFVVGEYGAGKTFFLHLVRAVALQRKLVTVHADLTPERRLYSTSGLARALYVELLCNLATTGRPDGGALPAVVERFVEEAAKVAGGKGIAVDGEIRERLSQLQESPGGFDFAKAVGAYWRGHESGDAELKTNAIRWIRGEFTSKSDAHKALGVRVIVDDANILDHLKLLARFVRLSGYQGLLVCLDEMGHLMKMPSAQSRRTNYDQLLRIVNESFGGTAAGIGFVMGGTPDFLEDTRRGLFSHEALQSRLAASVLAPKGLTDYSAPVLRLANLSREDLFILLQRLRHVFASGDPSLHLVPDDALRAFMEHCSARLGDAYFRTPRSTVKAFVEFLSLLEADRSLSWSDLLGRVEISPEVDPDSAPRAKEGEDDLASFKL